MANRRKYIELTIRIHREGRRYTAFCDELGTASFGDSLDEAQANILDAVALHLHTLDRLGERERFFRERGIKLKMKLYPRRDVAPVAAALNEFITRTRVALPV